MEDGVDSGSHYLSADGTKVKDKMPEEPPPRRQKVGGPSTSNIVMMGCGIEFECAE